MRTVKDNHAVRFLETYCAPAAMRDSEAGVHHGLQEVRPYVGALGPFVRREHLCEEVEVGGFDRELACRRRRIGRFRR